MTLRRRLALWYGVLIAAVLTTAFTVAYLVHVEAHDEDLNRALTVVVDGVAADLRENLASGAPLAERIGARAAPIDEPFAIWLYRADLPFPVSSSGPTNNPVFGLIGLRTLPEGFATSWTSEGRVRSLVQPIGGFGRILVAADLRGMDEENSQLRGTLTLLGLLGASVGGVGTWVVAGHALRPVAELTATAEEVARSQDPSRRMRFTGGEDEIGRLARTFNEMLGSLEEAYRAQQRFVSDVSHEIRTPLTTIRGNAELLLLGDADRHEVADAAGHIAREAARLTRLVGELLSLARADAGPQPLAARPVELNEVVMEVFGDFRPLAGAAIRVTRLDPVSVLGERDRLKEVLITLLDNARRYTPSSGTIDVALRADAGEAVLSVTDTGIGISPEDAAHAFERFWRAENARREDASGSGLGLAIARWIVERHGGTIAFVPIPPPGARIEVRLPLEGAPLARPEASRDAEGDAAAAT